MNKFDNRLNMKTPNFGDRGHQNFRENFINLGHHRTCGKVWWRSAKRPRRLGGKKDLNYSGKTEWPAIHSTDFAIWNSLATIWLEVPTTNIPFPWWVSKTMLLWTTWACLPNGTSFHPTDLARCPSVTDRWRDRQTTLQKDVYQQTESHSAMTR